jgi:hypothetical protein
MAPERELLLEIRNEQIAHGQRLERIAPAAACETPTTRG